MVTSQVICVFVSCDSQLDEPVMTQWLDDSRKVIVHGVHPISLWVFI